MVAATAGMATTRAGVDHKIVPTLRIAVPALIAFVCLWPVVWTADVASVVCDDFFYYLVPAEHWANGAGSTYFPAEPTNCYHPLWFAWVAFLYWIAGDGKIFFGALALSVTALMIGFYFLFERFLRRVTGDRLAAAAGAGVAALPLARLGRMGLETSLTAFVAALLLVYLSSKPLAERTVREAAVVGLLSALLLLSRLDAAVLLIGLGVAIVARWDVKRLMAFAAGAAPLYLYPAINLWAFGHLATTSMTAKTLNLYLPPNWYFLVFPNPALGIALATAVAGVAVALVVLLWRNPNVDNRRLAMAVPVAVLLQFAAQALLSGWIMFVWYIYFAVMSLGLLVCLLVVGLRRRELRRRVAVPAVAVALLFGVLWIGCSLVLDPIRAHTVDAARRLQAFSVSHPGVYAMGDQAGTPGWLVKQPIVQLEGLAMSHEFTDRIRQRQPLAQVFRDYHVNYYVAWVSDGADHGSCHELQEPSPLLSSPRAPHMAIRTCKAPVAVIDPGPLHREVIYRIDPTTGQPM
ncbi:hypothetical protein [Mycobacterium szulgai]|nr:hypothetical protein [Mycobacterium szulgai]MCV7077662.1 hypothetical protein [Mycobacterium szulgai]